MKKIFIIFCSIVIIASGVGITYLVLYDNNDNNNSEEIKNDKSKKEECVFLDGGSYNLIFNTNGGKEISSINICIACSPDSYENIPTPTRDGYNFDGWYFDKELTKKIEFTSTKDFEIIPEYDKNKCIIGYIDIEIFAKWIEKPKEDTKKKTTTQKKSSTNTTKKKETTKKDTAKKETTKQETNAKSFYYPSKSGTVYDNYGYHHQQKFLNYIKIHSINNELYPINNAEVVAWKYHGTNNYEARYILYKTTLNGEDIYVMYHSYCDLIKVKDYDMNNLDSRKVTYNDVIVKNNGSCHNGEYGNYRIVMAHHFSGDYNKVASVMLRSSYSDYSKFINPNQVFNLKV